MHNLKDLPLPWWYCFYNSSLFWYWLTLERDYTLCIFTGFPYISPYVHLPSIQIGPWTLFLNSPTQKLVQKTAFHSTWQLSWLRTRPHNYSLLRSTQQTLATINILIFTFRNQDLIKQNYFHSENLTFSIFLEF